MLRSYWQKINWIIVWNRVRMGLRRGQPKERRRKSKGSEWVRCAKLWYRLYSWWSTCSPARASHTIDAGSKRDALFRQNRSIERIEQPMGELNTAAAASKRARRASEERDVKGVGGVGARLSSGSLSRTPPEPTHAPRPTDMSRVESSARNVHVPLRVHYLLHIIRIYTPFLTLRPIPSCIHQISHPSNSSLFA